MVDTRSNIQLSDLNYKPHGGKSLQNLIDHTISVRLYPTQVSLHHQKLCLGQFHEPNHINCKQNKKREIKRQKHPVHKIVLRKPTQIRSKNTAQLFSLYLYGREYSDDQKPPAYFCPNILFLYEHKYRISVHHPQCMHHNKIPPHVTPPCRTTLYMKLHLYTLLHKTPPRNPAI